MQARTHAARGSWRSRTKQHTRVLGLLHPIQGDLLSHGLQARQFQQPFLRVCVNVACVATVLCSPCPVHTICRKHSVQSSDPGCKLWILAGQVWVHAAVAQGMCHEGHVQPAERAVLHLALWPQACKHVGWWWPAELPNGADLVPAVMLHVALQTLYTTDSVGREWYA